MTDVPFTIISPEDAVELTLDDTEIVLRLSQKIRDEAQNDLAGAQRDIDEAPRFIRRIAGWALGFARHATNLQMRCALDVIARADYRDGTIVFSYRHRPHPAFEDITAEINGQRRPILAIFAPPDAQAFVARVNALRGVAG